MEFLEFFEFLEFPKIQDHRSGRFGIFGVFEFFAIFAIFATFGMFWNFWNIWNIWNFWIFGIFGNLDFFLLINFLTKRLILGGGASIYFNTMIFCILCFALVCPVLVFLDSLFSFFLELFEFLHLCLF